MGILQKMKRTDGVFLIMIWIKHLSLPFILLKGWHLQVNLRGRYSLFDLAYSPHLSVIRGTIFRRGGVGRGMGYCKQRHFAHASPPLLVCLLSSCVQPSKWTCRRPWRRRRRRARRSAWSSATRTAAGCPRPWPSSRRPPAPRCPPSASSRPGLRAPRPTAATPSAGQCPKTMWRKGATGPSSTTRWRDTPARRRTRSRSSL